MALKIRLQRGGKTHAPRYRMVVAETSARRDGKFVEILGNYNPQARKNEKELDLNLERIDNWMKVGAKPTNKDRTIINRVRRTAVAEETPNADEASSDSAAEGEEKTPESAADKVAPEAEAGPTEAAAAPDSTEEAAEKRES